MNADGEAENVEVLEEEEKPDPRKFKPDLYASALANDTEKLIQLLAAEVPPTYIDPTCEWTALHWAAKHGNIAMLRTLLEHGASAPYHRMVQRAKKVATAANKALSSDKRPQLSRPVDNGMDNEDVIRETSSVAEVSTAATDEELDDKSQNDLDEEDEDAINEKRLETSIDLLKNTPLLWAACKGHLECVWLLLLDGYSPNDVDNLGNNALHLAAAQGNKKIIKALIDDGANASLVNVYKNVPGDMCTVGKDTKDMISTAMVQGASMTLVDIARMHEQNVKSYNSMLSKLQTALSDNSKANDSPRGRASWTTPKADSMRQLEDTLQASRASQLDESLIRQGDDILTKMEVLLDLQAKVQSLQRAMPMRTQASYIEHVHTLEKALDKAEQLGVDRTQTQFGRELISKCQAEYWLSTLTERVAAVTCAKDPHEHDMNRLRLAIMKAQTLRISDELLERAGKLHGRLNAELGMSRAIAAMPVMRLPLENPPEGYWQDCDKGHVVETPEYPLPPADTGTYIWEPASSYSAFAAAIAKLKESYVGGDGFSANPAVVTEAKEKLVRAEKELKLLDAKELADKTQAIEAATKLAKKMKKGGAKKK